MVYLGRVQSGVTGPGSQTQYLSLTGAIPVSSRRSPEGSAKLIGEAPIRTENWHTCPAGARTGMSRAVVEPTLVVRLHRAPEMPVAQSKVRRVRASSSWQHPLSKFPIRLTLPQCGSLDNRRQNQHPKALAQSPLCPLSTDIVEVGAARVPTAMFRGDPAHSTSYDEPHFVVIRTRSRLGPANAQFLHHPLR